MIWVYAVAAWAFAFAALSFYWALGGPFGAQTVPKMFVALVRSHNHDFMQVLWLVAYLKLLLGIVALLFGLPNRRKPWSTLLRLGGWTIAIGFLVYGIASFVQHDLMLAGIVRLPPALGEQSARWHIWLWDPWWALGGLLMIGAVRYFSRRVESL